MKQINKSSKTQKKKRKNTQNFGLQNVYLVCYTHDDYN